LLRVHEATVIDADFGYVSGSEKSGIIRLKSGKHPFRLYYVGSDLNTGKTPGALKLAWSGPGIAKQTVPAQALVHDAR
jgi:hypothetical protein